jgi:hypothetical protein
VTKHSFSGRLSAGFSQTRHIIAAPGHYLAQIGQVGVGRDASFVPVIGSIIGASQPLSFPQKTKGKLHISRNMFYSLRVTFLSADRFINVPYSPSMMTSVDNHVACDPGRLSQSQL